jgi:hypothetical protein
MYPDRKVYGYSVATKKDQEIYTAINGINKNLAKGGFFLGGLVVGGYFLFKKVNDLAKDVKRIKEEMGK